MNLSQVLTEQLKRHEGIRNKPYKDTVGKLTIGIGRNLDDVGLSDDEIEYLLQNDIRRAIEDAKKAVKTFDSLTLSRQAVVANMVFNLGLSRFLGFKNTIAAIERGDYKTASEGMLASLWAKQVGKRATELAKLMEDGQ